MPTILLIEDNRDIHENTAELLELEGFNILSARNGREGVEVAKAHLPDLILCDVMMPEMNGWEVIRLLKEDHSTSGIPFVFISASVEKKEIRSGFDLGADGYVRKPFEADELISTIKTCLNKKIIL